VSEATLFAGVRVFNGLSPSGTGPSDVLVRDGMIERVGPAEPSVPASDAVVIEGRGRRLGRVILRV
jgi:dihydroorotase-like cyclic amidohydrolase